MNRFRAGLAGAALASLIAAQGALAAEPLRLTQPIQATKNDIDPQRTYSAPHLVVDPSNPLHIIGGFGEMRTKTCGIMRSTDGGQNWKVTRSGALPNPTSHRFCLANNSNIFQANMAFGRDGRLYMAMLGWDEADTRNMASVAMARSDDLGESWAVQTVVRDARPGNDERRENNRPVGGIVVDAKSGSDDIVYVIYQRSLTGTTFTPGNAEPQQPMMAVSTDGGRTFREPVSVVGNLYENQAVRQSAFATATTTTIAGQTPATTTTAPAGTKGAAPDQVANFGGGSPDVTMAGDGTVYVAYRSAFANLTANPSAAVFVSKITNGGQTITPYIVSSFSRNNRANIRLAWSTEGGSQGTLHLVHETSDRPEVAAFANITYRRSTDAGATWTEPRILTDDNAAALQPKYIPDVAIAPNGRVDVVWWDTRNDFGIVGNDVYYTYSTDNGANWSENQRISDKIIDRKLGVWAYNFDQNSPPGLASTNDLAVIAWDDTRNSDVANPVNAGIGGGVQDIYTSVVQHAEIGAGGSNAVKYLLGGVLGLLAVGLVLLLVTSITRGRTGAGPSARSDSREAAGIR